MILLYGATGYTGRLVARTFAAEGLAAVLAGRREDALRQIAEPLGLDVRVGGLDDLDLSGAQVLLNCAGPFRRTQAPLLSRCMDAPVAYLDLAGEVDEHLAAAAWDAKAREAGVLVLPGVGYGTSPPRAPPCVSAACWPATPRSASTPPLPPGDMTSRWRSTEWYAPMLDGPGLVELPLAKGMALV